MLVAAAQAFYAATLFFSIGLSKPFRSEIFFGVFFAAAVLLIDRSIIGYAATDQGQGGRNSARRRRPTECSSSGSVSPSRRPS